MMNPFNQTDNDRLYNIATGKAAYLYTEEVLLTMNVSKCIKRLSKCIKQPERLEERISKQKMPTFETELGRKKFRDPNGKVFADCFLRGSLLCLSLEEKIDAIEIDKFIVTINTCSTFIKLLRW